MRYDQILTRLHNAPLAIELSKLDILTKEVTLKALSKQELNSEVIATSHSLDNTEVKELPVIKIYDSLVSKNGIGSSGITSYESIKEETNYFVKEGHKKLLYYFDTPGGEVTSLISTVNYLHNLKAQGIELIGIVDGMMASAGYTLGSAMSRIYATESSIIGSIGILMTLINTVKADEKEGYDYTIIKSRSDKDSLNPHEPFTKEALENATRLVKSLDSIMVDTITNIRPSVTTETIDSLNGTIVLAANALDTNLIDGTVSSIEEVIDLEKGRQSRKFHKPSSLIKGNTTMTLEEALAKIGSLEGTVAMLQQKVNAAEQDGVTKERTRVLGIFKAAETYKVSASTTMKRIASGNSVEDSTTLFEELAEAIQLGNSINTNVASPTSAHDPALATTKAGEGVIPRASLIEAIALADQIADANKFIVGA